MEILLSILNVIKQLDARTSALEMAAQQGGQGEQGEPIDPHESDARNGGGGPYAGAGEAGGMRQSEANPKDSEALVRSSLGAMRRADPEDYNWVPKSQSKDQLQLLAPMGALAASVGGTVASKLMNRRRLRRRRSKINCSKRSARSFMAFLMRRVFSARICSLEPAPAKKTARARPFGRSANSNKRWRFDRHP
jgi:hypothetical protein